MLPVYLLARQLFLLLTLASDREWLSGDDNYRGRDLPQPRLSVNPKP